MMGHFLSTGGSRNQSFDTCVCSISGWASDILCGSEHQLEKHTQKFSLRLVKRNCSYSRFTNGTTDGTIKLLFTHIYIYIWEDEKAKDISSEDILERTFLTVTVFYLFHLM